MKRIALLFIALSAFLLQSTSSGQGRVSKETANKIVRGILQEKIRPGIFKDDKFVRHVPVQYRSEARQYFSDRINTTERVVSGGSEAESELHAALNPLDSNNWVCSANAVDPNGSATTDVPVNHIYYTQDFGSTWTRSSFDPLPTVSGVTIAGGGDPNFAFDKNGRVYTSWINLYLQGFTSITWQLLWAYSDDGGITWQRGANASIIETTGPFSALFDPSLFNGPAADKEWLAVDCSNSAYQNNLYCAYYEVGGPNNLNTIAVRRKDAAASSFSNSVYVSDNSFRFVQFSGIDVDGSGNIHVSFFGSQDSINYAVYHSVSTDGGASFNSPNKVSDVQLYNYSSGLIGQTITGIDVQRMYPCSYIAADQTTGLSSSGNVYMVWTANGVNTSGPNAADIYFSRSTDGGASWSNAVPLNNTLSSDQTEQYYPSICVNASGVVIVSWYDRRNYPGTANTDYYIAWSNDGGSTFNNDIPVSNQPTDFNTVGAINQNFGIGEYNAVLSTEMYAIPIWSDGRTNDGEMNLYAAIVPLVSNVGLPVLNSAGVISLNVFPNPVYGFAAAELKSSGIDNVSLKIYNSHGAFVTSVFSGEITDGFKINLPVKSLKSGNYSLVLRSKRGLIAKEFVVLQN